MSKIIFNIINSIVFLKTQIISLCQHTLNIVASWFLGYGLENLFRTFSRSLFPTRLYLLRPCSHTAYFPVSVLLRSTSCTPLKGVPRSLQSCPIATYTPSMEIAALVHPCTRGIQYILYIK